MHQPCNYLNAQMAVLMQQVQSLPQDLQLADGRYGCQDHAVDGRVRVGRATEGFGIITVETLMSWQQ